MMIARRDKTFHDPQAAQAEADRQKRHRDLTATLRAKANESVGQKLCWYVLSVRSRSEKHVAEELEAKKICAWVPTADGKPVRHRGRLYTPKAMPIFRGYVFVHMVMNSYALAVLSAEKSVLGVLGDEGNPLPIDREFINAIEDLVVCGVFDNAPRDVGLKTAADLFEEGDKVQGKSGAYELFKATVTGYRGKRHVRCIAHLFGATVPVTVGIENLKKIG